MALMPLWKKEPLFPIQTPNIANQKAPLSLTDKLEGYKAGGHWWYRAKEYAGPEDYNFWKGNHDPAWDRLFNEVAMQNESFLEKVGPGTWVVKSAI